MKGKEKEMRDYPQDWQKDPAKITEPMVQYWRHGIMVTAQYRRDAARAAVINSEAFVMTGQAIGALDSDGRYDA